MQKILLLLAVSFLVGKNCEAQYCFPFSGLELSNYVAGDSLEYHYTATNQINGIFYESDFGWVIVSRDSFCVDSITYQVKGFGLSDTTQLGIYDDSIYGNDNNFLFVELTEFDTSLWTGLGDSANISFDTLSGNKRLKKQIVSGFIDDKYLAIQNLGVVYHHFATEDPVDWDYTYDLIFAHLNHYGTYGTYVEIPSSVINPKEIDNNLSIFPNPVSEQLTISLSNFEPLSKGEGSSTSAIELYDVFGRKLLSIAKPLQTSNIRLQTFPSGIYLLKVSVNGNEYVRKVVKE